MARDKAIDLRILGNICIKQIELHMADGGTPNLRAHLSLANEDFNCERRPIVILDLLQRQLLGMCVSVMLFLPTVATKTLSEIA